MDKFEKTTLNMIHTAAKKEFLIKGFKSASLRNIVKNAGVTTGAFYGYYKSKEELFDALVEKQYETLMECFRTAQKDFADLPPHQQTKNVCRKCLSICMKILKNLNSYLIVQKEQDLQK